MRREQQLAPSPSAAMRQALADYRADYDLGGAGRYLPTPKGVQISGSGADYHYRNETQFFRAIERARFYDRNNMIAAQGVNRLTANIVQDGFNLEVSTGDPKIDEDLEAAWWDWADDADQCDAEGEKTFQEMESLAFRSIVVDGDILCIPLVDGCLQWFEAHRLRRPRSLKRNNVHGVDVDPKTGRHIGYTIAREDVDPLRSIGSLKEVDQIDARDAQGNRQVFHQYFPNRFSQRRGVSSFAPIVFPLNYHDDLQFAKLVQAQQCSIWGIVEEQGELAAPGGPAGPMVTGSESTETLADGSTRTSQGSSPGMRVRLPRGVTAKVFSGAVPNAEFFDHAHLILTIIAVNLDLPVHVLLLDPSKTNFSGWRGAIDQARLRFRWFQSVRIRQFHTPVYKWWVRRRLALDPALRKAASRAEIDIFGHAWRPNAWGYIDPAKDIQAEALEAAICATSRRRQKHRQGLQWPALVPEIVDDNALLIKTAQQKAVELNKSPEFSAAGVVLTWRDLVNLPLPAGVSVALTGEQAPEPEPAEQPKKEPAR